MTHHEAALMGLVEQARQLASEYQQNERLGCGYARVARQFIALADQLEALLTAPAPPIDSFGSQSVADSYEDLKPIAVPIPTFWQCLCGAFWKDVGLPHLCPWCEWKRKLDAVSAGKAK